MENTIATLLNTLVKQLSYKSAKIYVLQFERGILDLICDLLKAFNAITQIIIRH